MPINFPAAPADNDVHTEGGRSWVYSAAIPGWRPATYGSIAQASQVEMETGTEAALRSMSPLRVKQAIDALGGAPSFSTSAELATILSDEISAGAAPKVLFGDQAVSTTSSVLFNSVSLQDGNSGWYRPGLHEFAWNCNGGTQLRLAASSELRLGSNISLAWSSSTSALIAADTYLYRSAAGEISISGSSSYADLKLRDLTASGTIKPGAFTVATLPGTPSAGMICTVTDAEAPVLGATVAAGGGADVFVTVQYNGTNWIVIALGTGGGSGSPSGSNTHVQFNDSGAFGGDAGLTFDKTTDTLTVGTTGTVGVVHAPNTTTYGLRLSSHNGIDFYNTQYGYSMGSIGGGIWQTNNDLIVGGVNVVKAGSGGGFVTRDTGVIGFAAVGSVSSGTDADTSISRVSAGVMGVGTGATGEVDGSLSLTNLTASGTLKPGSFTVATLPGAPTAGMICTVTDAEAPVLGSTVASGGGTDVFCTVQYNGTDWKVIGLGSGAGAPGGSTTQVQFNDAGAFGGDAGLVFDKTTDTLSVGTRVNVNSLPFTTNNINGGTNFWLGDPTTDVLPGIGVGGLFRISKWGGGLTSYDVTSGIIDTGFVLLSNQGIRWREALGFFSSGTDLNLTRQGVGVLQIGNSATADASGSLALTNLTAAGTIKPGAFTVATLPGSPSAGVICTVTDAEAPAIGSTVVSGGGADVFCTVQYDGTNWKVIALGTGGGGSPGGSNTQVQYNDSGAFGGNAEFLFDETNAQLKARSVVATGNMVAPPALGVGIGKQANGVGYIWNNNNGLVTAASDAFDNALPQCQFFVNSTNTFIDHLAFEAGAFSVGAGGSARISRQADGVLQIGTTSSNAAGSLALTNLTASGTIKPGAFTIATLPGSPTTGMICTVTDAEAPVLGATVASGGGTDVFCTVQYNGTAWKVIALGSGAGAPSGSDTQLQFNDGGSFGGDAGLTYNKTTDTLTAVAFAQTGQSLTGSSATQLLDLATTWNTTGAPTAIGLDVTDTASNAASKLMDLKVGGVSKFVVGKGYGTSDYTFTVNPYPGRIILGCYGTYGNDMVFLSPANNNVGFNYGVALGVDGAGNAGDSPWLCKNSNGVVGIGNGNYSNTDGSLVLANLTASGTVKAGGYTVSTLPGTPTAGMRAYVTDATATTFYSTVAGGGSNVVPVFHNGTNWVIA